MYRYIEVEVHYSNQILRMRTNPAGANEWGL